MGYEHSSVHRVHFTILNRIDMLPHYTNGSTAVENLSLQTACLLLSHTLIVNHSLFNCGGGPGLSICSGRPPKACHGVNVMLSLMGLVLQWQPVPQQPLSTAWRQPLRDITRPSSRMCKLLLTGGRKHGSVCLALSCIFLSGGLAVPMWGWRWWMMPTLFSTLRKPSSRWRSTDAYFDAKLQRPWSLS